MIKTKKHSKEIQEYQRSKILVLIVVSMKTAVFWNDATYSGKNVPIFQRTLVPPTSG
jgi:hypothetical protein